MNVVDWAAQESGSRLGPIESRWAHSREVAMRAREIACAVDVHDRGVLVAAAYLHDVGYATELAVHKFHPLDGGQWLRKQGHERLAGLVAHHTAARFEADAHGLIQVLGAFDDEGSAVSDALAYCDLTTGPTGDRVTVAERIGEIGRRYGATSLIARALDEASETLFAMVRRTEARLVSQPVGAGDVEGTFSVRKTSSASPSTR